MSRRCPRPQLDKPQQMQPLFQFEPIEYFERTQVLCAVGKPDTIQAHWHTDHEIIFGLAGETRVSCEGRRYTLRRGDLLFVNAMDLHELDAGGSDALVLTVNFDAGVLLLAFEPNDDPYRWHFLLEPGSDLPPGRASLLQTELLALAQTYFSAEAGSGERLAVAGRILCFLAYLFRWGLYRENTEDAPHSHEELSQIRALIAFLYANASAETLTPEVAAEKLGCTVRSLSDLLKRYTGKTFASYLAGVRVELAKKRLIFQSDRAVLDIALECGFSSLPTFYRTFRKLTGMTPNDFRDRMGAYMRELYSGGLCPIPQESILPLLNRFAQEAQGKVPEADA